MINVHGLHGHKWTFGTEPHGERRPNPASDQHFWWWIETFTRRKDSTFVSFVQINNCSSLMGSRSIVSYSLRIQDIPLYRTEPNRRVAFLAQSANVCKWFLQPVPLFFTNECLAYLYDGNYWPEKYFLLQEYRQQRIKLEEHSNLSFLCVYGWAEVKT